MIDPDCNLEAPPLPRAGSTAGISRACITLPPPGAEKIAWKDQKWEATSLE
jgi:hypothetical protein